MIASDDDEVTLFATSDPVMKGMYFTAFVKIA